MGVHKFRTELPVWRPKRVHSLSLYDSARVDRLWNRGLDTREIATRLERKEHEICNALSCIRETKRARA